MKLLHDSTLDEIAETPARLFLRSPRYLTNRWRGALICAAMFAAFAFLGFHAKAHVNLPVVGLAAAAWGAGLFLLTYKGSVRRRIKRYLVTAFPGPWPRPVVYEITAGQLTSTAPGTAASFALADFSTVTEDARYLELAFSNHALCVIPLHAFSSPEQKATFLKMLTS